MQRATPDHGHHAAPVAHHMVRWQRRALYTSGGVLTASGAAWLVLHYGFGAGAGELPHPLEPWCLRLHGLAAFASLFVLGALAAAHIPQGWRLARRPRWAAQRQTGTALCGTAALLAASGYLLYYWAPESVRPALGWAHAALGVAAAALVVRHRRAPRPPR